MKSLLELVLPAILIVLLVFIVSYPLYLVYKFFGLMLCLWMSGILLFLAIIAICIYLDGGW